VEVLSEAWTLVKAVQDIARQGKIHAVHRDMLVIFLVQFWSLLNPQNETCLNTFITIFVRFYMSMSCLFKLYLRLIVYFGVANGARVVVILYGHSLCHLSCSCRAIANLCVFP